MLLLPQLEVSSDINKSPIRASVVHLLATTGVSLSPVAMNQDATGTTTVPPDVSLSPVAMNQDATGTTTAPPDVSPPALTDATCTITAPPDVSPTATTDATGTITVTMDGDVRTDVSPCAMITGTFMAVISDVVVTDMAMFGNSEEVAAPEKKMKSYSKKKKSTTMKASKSEIKLVKLKLEIYLF